MKRFYTVVKLATKGSTYTEWNPRNVNVIFERREYFTNPQNPLGFIKLVRVLLRLGWFKLCLTDLRIIGISSVEMI